MPWLICGFLISRCLLEPLLLGIYTRCMSYIDVDVALILRSYGDRNLLGFFDWLVKSRNVYITKGGLVNVQNLHVTSRKLELKDKHILFALQYKSFPSFCTLHILVKGVIRPHDPMNRLYLTQNFLSRS